VICTNAQGNIDTSTSCVVKELSKGEMTGISGWRLRILKFLQEDAEVYED
jgi:hypothetical protein